MRVKFNSYTYELIIESKLQSEWQVMINLKNFFLAQSIHASLPVVEYDYSINRLLIAFDDTRFKIYNSELQFKLLQDCMDLINSLGYQTESEYKLDEDFFIQGELNNLDLENVYNLLKRTESYPQLFSVPYQIEYQQEYTKEYYISLIGLWNDIAIQKLLSSMKPQLASQCKIVGTEFKKTLVVSELDTAHKETFLELQLLVVNKDIIKIEEFGDYRFYQMQ